MIRIQIRMERKHTTTVAYSKSSYVFHGQNVEVRYVVLPTGVEEGEVVAATHQVCRVPDLKLLDVVGVRHTVRYSLSNALQEGNSKCSSTTRVFSQRRADT